MSKTYNTRQSAMQFMTHGVQDTQQQHANQGSNLKQEQVTPEKSNQEQNKSNPSLIDTKTEAGMEITSNGENSERPPWKKLGVVKRISNKERRRRQNQSLRRLVSPKSALMVLNEMVYGAPLDFRVDCAPPTGYYASNNPSFCAEVTIDGCSYRGCGETKTSARSAAAEQAVRDIIIKKLNKFNTQEKSNEAKDGEEKMETEEEEPMPMIQLASYALHKLFSEWEGEGHHVPQIRPHNSSVSDTDVDLTSQANGPPPPKPKKVKTLPENAAEMHPCMLLSYMRPMQEYRELGVQGDRPQNLIYTIGVEVDGATFIGQGPNKKEARKDAATSACNSLFGVKFQQT
ncbi:spermatid perinuclear RNA-binding protein-like isoform X1 [Pieris napi]|uniref:spermatid perinuclear RNA-binding protein-like isoform X1 n=3 Tax=Pieris napi TaxID=78633 RepID=UPI001FBAD65F|nr:spermatid perinuclear RNA-binding protein-like isoform X1 [Pieris napi]